MSKNLLANQSGLHHTEPQKETVGAKNEAFVRNDSFFLLFFSYSHIIKA